MAGKESHTSITHYFFIFLLCFGAAVLLYSFIGERQEGLFSGLRQIGTGITLIGIGEWINHPLQKSVTYKKKDDYLFKNIHHRKRNPSAIGNLLEICGLILIFTGLADYV